MAYNINAHEKSRDRLNWKIYELYVAHQIDACLQLIETQLYACRGQCEFAIYVKGLLQRNQGNISESLELFQAATVLNPSNIANLKQVARSLYLLGRYEAAVDIYDKAQQIEFDDWEIWHNKGLCLEKLSKYEECIESYEAATAVQQHDSTFIRLANVYVKQNKYKEAIETYKEALEFSPESSLLLTSLGLLYLKINAHFSAFTTLGSSLSLNSINPTTILAAGSIIQSNQDIDVALVKYRVAASGSPNSCRLWNNIGMCFYAKRKYIEAISSFRRAIYLNPFDWAILYNLGLVYMATSNFCSAFQQFSAAINLNKTSPLLFMYLGVSLCYLNDFENGCIALDRSLKLIQKMKSSENNQSDESSKETKEERKTKIVVDECLIHINFCVVLLRRINDEHIEMCGPSKPFQFRDDQVKEFKSGDEEEDDYLSYIFERYTQHKKEAFGHWKTFQEIWKPLDDESKNTQLCNVSRQQSLLQNIFSS